MDTLQFIAWILVHIAIPILAPIALLPLLAVSRTFRSSANGVVYNAVKNGQLLWVAIALCAGACYEMGAYLEHATTVGHAFAWTGLFFCMFLITISAVLVMLGAIDGLDDSFDARKAEPSRIMIFSILLTAASAVTFGCAHYFIALG